jgi:hypothetical protein
MTCKYVCIFLMGVLGIWVYGYFLLFIDGRCIEGG